MRRRQANAGTWADGVLKGLRAFMVCLAIAGAVSAGAAGFVCGDGQECPVEAQEDCCDQPEGCTAEACGECCATPPDSSEQPNAVSATALSFEVAAVLHEELAGVCSPNLDHPPTAPIPLEISLANAPPPVRDSRAPPSLAI